VVVTAEGLRPYHPYECGRGRGGGASHGAADAAAAITSATTVAASLQAFSSRSRSAPRKVVEEEETNTLSSVDGDENSAGDSRQRATLFHQPKPARGRPLLVVL